MVFRDRVHGGERLASELERFGAERPIVLGLTRGGVPVAREVARRLGATLDALVVRKIGAPMRPEYALGAVAEGGGLYLNEEAVSALGLATADLAALAEPELREVARRVRLYRRGEPPADVAGRTVLVVDDGVATGSTVRAACRAVRARGAARVVVAAPVIAAQTAPALRADCDEVVAVAFPEDLAAVGLWYRTFDQVSDETVLACLDEARRGPAGAAPETVAGELWDGEWSDLEAERPAASLQLERDVRIPVEGGHVALEGTLAIPPSPRGLVLFVHGSGSSRRSPRNQAVARALQGRGLATLLFDLLTRREAAEDEETGRLRFDVELLARRVLDATRWTAREPLTRGLSIGYFGASTGAAAALVASAAAPEHAAALVSRGGRPDLVPPALLRSVTAPVLLLVGGLDDEVLALNRAAARHLGAARLVVVPGASHLFEERGALPAVARAAADFFARQLSRRPG